MIEHKRETKTLIYDIAHPKEIKVSEFVILMQ
jgi:hypothetical protein